MSAINKIIDRLASEEYPDEKSMLRIRKMVEEARGELGALRDENRQLERNRCNSGHETLPLRLWDCPECGRIKREKLEAELDRLRAIVGLFIRPDESGCGIDAAMRSAAIRLRACDETAIGNAMFNLSERVRDALDTVRGKEEEDDSDD